MSQEQSESVEEMVRRLLGLQMASWRKEDIEKKFKLVMQVYSLDMEISASKERFTELTKKNQKENNEIELVKKEIEIAEQNTTQLNTMIDKAADLQQVLYDRFNSMENFMDNHIEVKSQQSLKQLDSLENKVENMKGSIGGIDEAHQKVMEEKARTLDEAEAEKARVVQEIATTQQKIEEVDAKTAAENELLASIAIKIEEANIIIDATKALKDEVGRLDSRASVDAAKLEKLHNTEMSIRNEIDSFNNEMEKMQLEHGAAVTQFDFLQKRTEEVAYLVDFVQRKKEADEMEQDEIFQRDIANEQFYNECKNYLASKITDNETINEDFEQHKEQLERQHDIIEESKRELSEVRARISALQAEIEELNIEEVSIQKQLKARSIEEHREKELLTKKIEELKLKQQEAEAMLELKENERIKVVAELNMRLKNEQKKTEEMRARQLTEPTVTNRLIETMINATQTSSFDTTYKQVSQGFERHSLNSSTLSDHRISSFQAYQRSSLNAASLDTSTVFDKTYAKETIRHSAPVINLPAIETSEQSDTSHSSVDSEPKVKKLSRRKTVLIDNIPIYKDADNPSKPEAAIEVEKAFDTDSDEDMSVSFNTDVGTFITESSE